MTKWTRLEGTGLWTAAKQMYESNPHRVYHGWNHIERLYAHAADTFGFKYDLNLDLAILCHDVVYDDQPLKELRSADWMEEKLGGQSLPKARELIMSTETHKPCLDNRMILVDLISIRDPQIALEDRELVRIEMKATLGCSDEEFARGNRDFFRNLANLIDQAEGTPRIGGAQVHFWDIRKGIDAIIAQANLELGESPHPDAG